MAAVLVLLLLFWVSPAEAKPKPAPNPCAEQVAAARQVTQTIRVHNRRTVNRTSTAAIAAYNAEATRLNAKRAPLLARLRKCVEAIGITHGRGRLSDAYRTKAPPKFASRYKTYQRRLPTNWGHGVSGGKSGYQVPKSSPGRAFYELLRRSSP